MIQSNQDFLRQKYPTLAPSLSEEPLPINSRTLTPLITFTRERKNWISQLGGFKWQISTPLSFAASCQVYNGKPSLAAHWKLNSQNPSSSMKVYLQTWLAFESSSRRITFLLHLLLKMFPKPNSPQLTYQLPILPWTWYQSLRANIQSTWSNLSSDLNQLESLTICGDGGSDGGIEFGGIFKKISR